MFKKIRILKLMHNKFQYNFNELKTPCLTRDFIYDRLYHPKQGYFCQNDIQIGELKQPINFKNMFGYEDYQREVSEKYPKNAWLTPSELFKPWYGLTIGNYISQVHYKQNNPFNIRIVEAGAGGASAAESILFFFRNFEQKLYQNLEYHIVEISPQMCQRAKEKLSIDHKKLIDQGRIKIIQDDICNYKIQNVNQPCFLLMLEVLDNMPHDRVFYDESQKDWTMEALVDIDKEQKFIEIKRKITDKSIQEVLEIRKDMLQYSPLEENKMEQGMIYKIFKQLYKNKEQQNMFIPTHCYKLLKQINRNIPKNHVIFADFDMLHSNIKGINAPIVSKKLEKSHEKFDYPDYLVNRGEADIFFPTDFRLLKHMYKQTTGKKGKILKSYEFIDQFSKEKWAQTESGYNPLKEDFMNTSFFVTELENKK